MSESGLDEAKVKINNLTSKAVEAGNDAVTKSSIENLTSENIESTQNEIFKRNIKNTYRIILKVYLKLKMDMSCLIQKDLNMKKKIIIMI